MEKISRKIIKLRNERGWTQKELSKKSNVSISNLCNIENNKKKCRMSTIEKIAGAFGLSLFDFLKYDCLMDDENENKILRVADFEHKVELVRFVNRNNIKKDDIQAIVGNFTLFYWVDNG